MSALGLGMRMEKGMRWMFCSSLGERLKKLYKYDYGVDNK